MARIPGRSRGHQSGEHFRHHLPAAGLRDGRPVGRKLLRGQADRNQNHRERVRRLPAAGRVHHGEGALAAIVGHRNVRHLRVCQPQFDGYHDRNVERDGSGKAQRDHVGGVPGVHHRVDRVLYDGEYWRITYGREDFQQLWEINCSRGSQLDNGLSCC
uniref:(northern house mosquito) hypothetical protein n=1 Tax=Culex pipiens TaxID=7175 RepID=A0A8D8BBL7_CULPI